jgi:hypothetical protein
MTAILLERLNFVKVAVVVVLVTAALPLLYAAIRGLGASLHLERTALSRLTLADRDVRLE